MKVFRETDIEAEDFRILACSLDYIPLFSLSICSVHVGDEFDDFILDLVSKRIFVLFREFFDDSEGLYQEIVGGSVHGEIIILGHGFLGELSV